MSIFLPAFVVFVITMWLFNYLRPVSKVRGENYTVPKGVLQGPDNFVQVRLSEIFPISEDSKIFRFELPNDLPLGLPIGQHINLKATIDGTDETRQYTPISRLNDMGFFDIPVKIYMKNPAAGYLHAGKMTQCLDNLKVGDKVMVSGPCGRMQYFGNGEFLIEDQVKKVRYVGFIAAGTGIAPCFQLMQYSASETCESLHMSLVYESKTENDILLRPFIEELVAEQRLASVYYVLEKAPQDWKMGKGRINVEVLQEYLPPPTQDTLIMYCGSKSFTGELQQQLAELGYTSEMQFKF